MDGSQFSRLCRDTGIQDDARCKARDVDIAFSRACRDAGARGAKRVGFAAFCQALAEVAARRWPRQDADEALMRAKLRCVEVGGPILTDTTRPQHVPLVDDREDFAQREAERKMKHAKRLEEHGGPVNASEVDKETQRRRSPAAWDAGGDPVHRAFLRFVRRHSRVPNPTADLDVTQWVAMLRESHLLDDPKGFNRVDAELQFARLVGKGHKRIGWEQALNGLSEVALKLFDDESPERAVALVRDAVISAAPDIDETGAAGGAGGVDGKHDEDEHAARERERAERHARRLREHGGAVDRTELAKRVARRSTSKAFTATPKQFLKQVFLKYVGKRDTADLDVSGWLRLLNDAGLLTASESFDKGDATGECADPRATCFLGCTWNTCADAGVVIPAVMHASLCTKGIRRIDYSEFVQGLHDIAEMIFDEKPEKEGYRLVHDMVVSSAREDHLHATRPDSVRLAEADAEHDARERERRAAHEERLAAAGGVDARAVMLETERRRSDKAWSTGKKRPLKKVFCNFVRGHRKASTMTCDLDVTGFLRLMTDCGLLDHPRLLSKEDCELIHASHLTKGFKRISFKQFTKCLHAAAEKLHPDLEAEDAYAEVRGAVIMTGGPLALRGRRASAVRLAGDDDGEHEAKEAARAERHQRRLSDAGAVDHTSIDAIMAKRRLPEAWNANGDDLKAAFLSFVRGHSHDHETADLDVNSFVRMLADSGLIHARRFSKTDAELLFTSIRTRGTARIDFAQTKEALKKISEHLGKSYAEVADRIVETGGPRAAHRRP